MCQGRGWGGDLQMPLRIREKVRSPLSHLCCPVHRSFETRDERGWFRKDSAPRGWCITLNVKAELYVRCHCQMNNCLKAKCVLSDNENKDMVWWCCEVDEVDHCRWKYIQYIVAFGHFNAAILLISNSNTDRNILFGYSQNDIAYHSTTEGRSNELIQISSYWNVIDIRLCLGFRCQN